MLWPVEQDKICYSLFHSFETQPRPTGRPEIRPTRGWNQVELKKIGKFMTRCDPADPEKLGKKPGCNPLTFVFFFFTKTTLF
jgi:hypothetical protein